MNQKDVFFSIGMKEISWCIYLAWLVPFVSIQRLQREISLKIDMELTTEHDLFADFADFKTTAKISCQRNRFVGFNF